MASEAHDLSSGAKHVASDVAQSARTTAEAQIAGSKDRAADGIAGVADALRHTGEQLRTRDDLGLSQYVVRAADGVEAASDYLRDRTLGQLMADVEGFARREPALFLGGAFAAGVIAGRFLKSSSPAPVQQSAPAGSMRLEHPAQKPGPQAPAAAQPPKLQGAKPAGAGAPSVATTARAQGPRRRTASGRRARPPAMGRGAGPEDERQARRLGGRAPAGCSRRTPGCS